MLSCLPDAWMEHARPGPPRAPLWEVSACGAWVRPGRAGAGAPPLLSVLQDGRLGPASGAVGPVQAWQPAAVVFAPCQRNATPTVALPSAGGHLQGVMDIDGLQPYLLGPWSERLPDPNVWAVGKGMAVSHFVVASARLRLLHAAAREGGHGYVPGEGVCPRLWGSGGDSTTNSLAAWEHRQQTQLQRVRQGTGVGGVRRRRDSSSDVDPYAAIWMHESAPRDHPLQRAAAGHQAAAAAAAAARIDDSVDAVSLSQQQQPWQQVYRGLWGSGLGREAAHFAWRLLHRGLACGAVGLVMLPATDPDRSAAISGCLCRSSLCASAATAAAAAGPSTSTAVAPVTGAPLETLTHLFWDCPVVAPAVQWLWDLWGRLEDAAPSREPSTLLLGKWQPASPALRRMWLHLRVALLHAVWVLRQRRARGGEQYAAERVVALACGTVEAAIRADYLAVTTDLPRTAGLGREWFRGRARGPSGLEQFVAWWCHRGVLARVVGGGGSSSRGQRLANGQPGSLVVCIPRMGGAA